MKKVAIAVVVLILAFLVFATTKPDTFRVQRAASINALPETIFALINDFHDCGPWSPFERLDTAMTRTHSGAGRMEIAESSPPSKVAINLDFVKTGLANPKTVAEKQTGDAIRRRS